MWRLWVPDGKQIGGVPLEEARLARIETTIGQILVAHVFFGSDETNSDFAEKLKAALHGETVETGATKALSTTYLQFGQQLDAALNTAGRSKDERETLKASWTQLKQVLNQASAQTSQAPGGEGLVEKWPIVLYVLAVRALLQALLDDVLRDILAREAGKVSTDDESDAEESEDDNADSDYIDQLNLDQSGVSCNEHALRAEIEQRLRLWLYRLESEGESAEAKDLANCLPQFASAIAEALCISVPGARIAVERNKHDGWNADGEKRTITRLTLVDKSDRPSLAKRIREALTMLPVNLTWQPLSEVPRYIDDATKSHGKNAGAKLLPLVQYRSGNHFLRAFHRENPASVAYVKAINAQQAVPWRINRDLYQVALKLIVRVTESPGSDASGVEAWILRHFYRPPSLRGRRLTLPGEMLDHPLARRALEALVPSETDPGPEFYLAWKADYRGRIYAHTPWLTPQGGDFQRALFEFHEGVVLDQTGSRALKRHGANLVPRGRLLADLGIKDRSVVTLEERERWVDANSEQIIASASDPLREAFWREAAPDEPMQFLAFCLAWKKFREEPESVCHLPVQIDGTCNGLQHIAALIGDVGLGREVNLSSREAGLPGDIYVEVARVARAELAELGKIAIPSEAESLIGGVNSLLGKVACDLDSWIDRGTAKRVVMTIPYGASAGTQRGFVIEGIAERFEQALDRVKQAEPDFPLDAELTALGKEFERLRADHRRNQWFMAMLRNRRALRRAVSNWRMEFKNATKSKDAKKRVSRADDQSQTFLARLDAAVSAEFSAKKPGDAWHQWCGAAVILGVMAGAIVEAERNALKKLYPRAEEFGKWLNWIGGQCQGLPIAWETPLGFPVCQDAFKVQRTSFTVNLGNGHKPQIGFSRLLEQNSAGGQSRRLLPNLIHSLDATHLAMAVKRAQSLGLTSFGSIHDCLLCRPNEADRWKSVLAESFADLYRRDYGKALVLTQWTGWMRMVAELAGVNAKPVSRLVGFLDYPDANAEMTSLPVETRALLAEIRSRAGTEASIASRLVRYRQGADYIPPKNAMGNPPASTANEEPRDGKSKAVRRRKHYWEKYDADDDGFDITQVCRSAYFFS